MSNFHQPREEMLDPSLRHGWRPCWYGTSGALLLGIIQFGGLFKILHHLKN